MAKSYELDMQGPKQSYIQTITRATFTIQATRGTWLCDCTSNAITITLPTTFQSGDVVYIKKTDSTANTLTIAGAGTQTIDDCVSIDLTRQYESVTLMSDRDRWYIL